jgi:addiction module HigA family antidote
MENRAVPHPGKFIKENVIPVGMAVKKAAELLGVGRPALSNLIHGNSSLSTDMALRLEKAFGATSGVKREELLQMQLEYDEAKNREREKQVAVRTFVPSFIEITATQIEAWASKLEARSELPALLRKLILSTANNISKINFPAYDNAQRHGWDGELETDSTTPWIPAGSSRWEFGCNENPKLKAESDYNSRVAAFSLNERQQLTFVFVTPRNWVSKDAWAAEKIKENAWKNIQVFDANDLEQWLEQSVSAQNWFAERLGILTEGVLSLEECWDRWAKVTAPEMSKKLFASSVETNKNSLLNWLMNPPNRPYVIASDSNEETLAYLACVFDTHDEALRTYADSVLVISSASALLRAKKSSSKFIAIIASAEAEAASAGMHKIQHTVIVRRRNAVEGDNEIELDLIDDKTFETGLAEMGIAEQEARRLVLASGQSLTILRRRLSVIPAIQSPPWAKNNDLTRKLVSLGFAGAWDSRSDEDKEVLSCLMGQNYSEVEDAITELLTIEHSPVWSVGRFRGVASKLDVLFAVHRLITKVNLDDFFLVARLVLSERDPALDLPEDKRSWASLYGKTRNYSAALREGMCETLILLSIHGNNLFRERLGIDVEANVEIVIRDSLIPFSTETWASQKSDLPKFAEAAPDLFLKTVKEDLQSEDPKILELLKPASRDGLGGGCPRSGLLWALELLAWNPVRLPVVVGVLAQLSAIKIDDNWVNKPENSLQSIFRAWMPQTAAPIEDRCRALEILCQRFPEIGWKICIDQLDPMSTIGHYSHRPRWRKDASGNGQRVTNGEVYTFRRKALELAIAWSTHSAQTFGDLLRCTYGFTEEDQQRIWDAIYKWSVAETSESERAALREKVRMYSFTGRARKRNTSKFSANSARKIYDLLAPSDPIMKHRWLFARQWVEESFEELEEISFDYRKREEKIVKLRSQAIGEIWNSLGYNGIVSLCERGEASNVIGNLIPTLSLLNFDSHKFLLQLVSEPISRSPNAINACVTGFLFRIEDSQRTELLSRLVQSLKELGDGHEDLIIRLLTRAPTKNTTWRIVDALHPQLQNRYWAEAFPNWFGEDPDEVREMVDRYLGANRPQAAFAGTRLGLEKLDSARIVHLLKELSTKSSSSDSFVQFQTYEIARAFGLLDERADVSDEELAHLEFRYLAALEHEERGIPKLERQLISSPALFVQAVGLIYKRKDDGIDPEEWHIDDEQARTSAATQAYRLISKCRLIPGTDENGKTDVGKLRAWIKEVQTQCSLIGRREVGDSSIGQLLASSKTDLKDGVWPIIPIREVLEEVGNEQIANAMSIGLYNQRGVVWRDIGGKQERELVAKYLGWSKVTAIEWPFVSRLLAEIAHSYDREAHWHDTEAKLRQRLPY